MAKKRKNTVSIEEKRKNIISIEEIRAGIELKAKQREAGVRRMWRDIEKLKKEMRKGKI